VGFGALWLGWRLVVRLAVGGLEGEGEGEGEGWMGWDGTGKKVWVGWMLEVC